MLGLRVYGSEALNHTGFLDEEVPSEPYEGASMALEDHCEVDLLCSIDMDRDHYRPRNTGILIIGTPTSVSPILGNHHLGQINVMPSSCQYGNCRSLNRFGCHSSLWTL